MTLKYIDENGSIIDRPQSSINSGILYVQYNYDLPQELINDIALNGTTPPTILLNNPYRVESAMGSVNVISDTTTENFNFFPNVSYLPERLTGCYIANREWQCLNYSKGTFGNLAILIHGNKCSNIGDFQTPNGIFYPYGFSYPYGIDSAVHSHTVEKNTYTITIEVPGITVPAANNAKIADHCTSDYCLYNTIGLGALISPYGYQVRLGAKSLITRATQTCIDNKFNDNSCNPPIVASESVAGIFGNYTVNKSVISYYEFKQYGFVNGDNNNGFSCLTDCHSISAFFWEFGTKGYNEDYYGDINDPIEKQIALREARDSRYKMILPRELGVECSCIKESSLCDEPDCVDRTKIPRSKNTHVICRDVPSFQSVSFGLSSYTESITSCTFNPSNEQKSCYSYEPTTLVHKPETCGGKLPYKLGACSQSEKVAASYDAFIIKPLYKPYPLEPTITTTRENMVSVTANPPVPPDYQQFYSYVIPGEYFAYNALDIWHDMSVLTRKGFSYTITVTTGICKTISSPCEIPDA